MLKKMCVMKGFKIVLVIVKCVACFRLSSFPVPWEQQERIR